MTAIGRRGSVRQASNGSWYFVIDTTLPGGPRRQARRRGFPTRRSAQSALVKILAELSDQSHVAPSNLTLREYLEDRWLPVVAQELRPSTFDSYRRNLRLHVLPKIGHVPLQVLDASVLTQLYLELGTVGRKNHDLGAPLSPRTVTYVHTILRRALQMAYEWDLTSRNVADRARPPRLRAHEKRHEMRTWTAEQVAVFLGSVRGDRLYSLWAVLSSTGLRRGEALGLPWEAVDLNTGRLSVVRCLADVVDAEDDRPVWTDPKTARGRRSISLDPVTAATLRGHRVAQAAERLASGAGCVDHRLVFCERDGRPLHPNRLTRTFHRRVRDAGLPDIRLHDLRHTWATLALQTGVHPKVVQERLGHSSVSITLDIYSHVSAAMETDAANRVAALFMPSG